MQPDDTNHRPTTTPPPPAEAADPSRTSAPNPDATRTIAVDPSATLAHLGPPIAGPVAKWPAGLTRYKPLHLLGEGGMGEVYLAHDAQLDRQIAIKFARRATADTSARILAEARAAARLHHAGICPVFDADVCDGVPYLTMAFVVGTNLAAELKRLGPCPPAYAARLVRAVAEAMQYAHDSGVIHRDLKPANIVLNAAHEPVVTDFGLAVRVDREGMAEGEISGTPHYMAPEQAAGDAGNIGERTDVFALGVILFEMLTGRVPFDGTPGEVLVQVKTKTVPPVRKVRRQVPAKLAKVVAKATARRPADRYESMTAFADALSDYLRTAQPPPKKSLGWLWWLLTIPGGLFLGGCLLPCGLALLLPAVVKVLETEESLQSAKERTASIERLVEEADQLAADGKLGPALGKCDEAVNLDADRVELRLKRAELRMKAERNADALADLNHAISLDPTSGRAHRLRAAVRERLNDLAGSEADNLRATELEKAPPK